MNEAHSLPALIRQARMRKGLTQRELAKRLSVGETTVRAWETGRHRPSLALQSRLEDVLALSLSHVHQHTTSLTTPAGEDAHLDKSLEQEPQRRRGMLDRARDGSPNRSRMLQRVQMYWISGILEQSLSHSMSLPLQLQEHPLLVANPWSLDVQEAMSKPPSVLHQATSIVKAYDDANGALLIVGEAGAGKTTLLLQLTRALLQRAREDETHPLPVVFHLSSWAEKRLSLADWLIEELKSKYQVPRTIAQQWVTNETILPLLDGLDEVVASHRAVCVETINHYRQEHSLPMVVCSRSAEYRAQGISLRLHRAVVVQPLTPSQVDLYLLRMLPHPTVLRDALAQDEVLRDMATNPLTLSTMVVAYRDQPFSQQLMTGTIAQRRTLILSHYVERILTNRGPKTAFTFSQTRRYFTWLAQEMLKHNQVTFYLERLQPDWLPTVSLRDRYENVALRLIYGLEIIVTTALYAWMRGGKVEGSISTFGVGAGLFGQLGAGPGNTVFAWMAPGLGGGVEAGGSLGLIFTLVFSITTLLIGGSPFPLSWTSIVHALKQGVKHLLIAGGAVSLLCLVIFSIFGGWRHGLIYGGGAGIFAGVVIGLLSVFANLRGSLQEQRRSVRTRLIDGAIIGLCGGVGFALVDILLRITVQSVFIYTFIIFLFTFCAFSFGGANQLLSLGTIRPAETISWSWHTIGKSLPPIMMQGAGMTIGIASCVGAIFTLVSGAFYGFEYGIRYGLIAGLIAGVVVGVVGVLASLLHHAWSPALLATTRLFRPNEGIHRSLLNAVLVGLLFAPVSGLISGITCGMAFGVLGHLESWSILAVGFAVIFGLYIGFQFAMIHGGIAWLSHYLLRLFLWYAGVAPLNVVRFLDDGVEHVVLRKLGGGYMFSHRVLLDYFASVSSEEESSSPSPELSN